MWLSIIGNKKMALGFKRGVPAVSDIFHMCLDSTIGVILLPLLFLVSVHYTRFTICYYQPTPHYGKDNMSSAQSDWCAVFNPSFDTVAFDPLDLQKRYHEGIFVEDDPKTQQGIMFHVTGDIIAPSGMRFETKEGYAAQASAHLHSYAQIGWVRRTDFDSGRIKAMLRALPTPTKQQGLNFWGKGPSSGYHEYIWTKTNGEPYGPGEQRRPIIKCNEWTHQLAIPTLMNADILRTTRS